MHTKSRIHTLCAAMALIAAAGSSIGAGNPGDDGVARPGDRQLAFTGGAAFHSTANPVLDQRLIVVPDSPTRIMLWTERLPDGRLQAYEAISLGGGGLLGAVRELDNTVRVRYQNFDPAAGVAAMEPALAAAPGNTLHLVQFVCTPLDEFRKTVEEMGGEILRFMAENGYIVRMDRGVAAQVAALPYVRWVGDFHTGYKLAPEVLDDLRQGGAAAGAQRYSIEVFKQGLDEQNAVAARIAAMGGVVHFTQEGLFRMEATLSATQLMAVARMNEVHFIGYGAGPLEGDMDIVRNLGGANFIETTLGFTGEGVRAEVFDTELLTTHQEFSHITPVIHSLSTFTPSSPGVVGDQYHGTSVFSISFARGAVAAARGLLPDSEEQMFYHARECTQNGLNAPNGTHLSRMQIAADLANGASNLRSVYQTSSVGNPRNLIYDSISQEMDTVLATHNVLHCQSQSNAGATANPRMSRPQAWAKNILSVGAVNHQNTAGRADDTWLGATGGTSTGPAEDGRIKPELCFFYDMTHAAERRNDAGTITNGYGEFGGTSGATPSVCGYTGLFQQMWHEGVWAGRGGGSSVWHSRPQQLLVKAALISTAFRYNWPAGGANGSLDRFKQGFGMPDLQSLYNLRARTVIHNEEDALAQGQSKVYNILVAPGEPALNVVMCYMDPAGTTSSSQHRINDLSLKVTEPNGTTIRWGNNGLTAGNFNTTGGSANTKDTTECVFVQNPVAGVWKVEVIASQVTVDARPETPGVNADFAMWLTGGVVAPTGPACLQTAAANNGRTEANAGVFLDLKAIDENLEVTRIECATGSPAGNVTVAIRVRNGSYVGADASSAGWTLWDTVTGVSDGTQFVVDLAAKPLRVVAGTTTGVYLVNQSAGGVRYTGTGGVVQETWSDGELQVFSNVARGGPIFTGTRFSPRVFSGRICYNRVEGCPSLELDPMLSWRSSGGAGQGRSVYFRANEDIQLSGAAFFADMPAGNYQCLLYRGAGEFAAPGPLLMTANFASASAGERWRDASFAYRLAAGQDYILHFRHAISGTAAASTFQHTNPFWGNASGENLDLGPVTILDGREGYNAQTHSNAAFPRMRLHACSAGNFVIDFDYFPGADGRLHTADDLPIVAPTLFANASPLTTAYKSVGVVFNPNPGVNDKNEILNNASFSVPAEATAPNIFASASAASIDANFTRTVYEVAALVGVSSGADRLQAWDQNNVSIASVVGDDATVRIKAPIGRSISRIQVRNEPGATTPTIDNLYVRTAATGGPGRVCPCVCDFDASTGPSTCDIFDFLAFQNHFDAASPCACDMDVSTGESVCDVFDFLAFRDAFDAGCP